MADPSDNPNGSEIGGASTDSADDFVIPFHTVRSNISGRIVRLGPGLDRILSRHGYPDAIGEVLGQALALTSLLGSALKFEGRLILQTKSDGPLDLLVANYDAPGNLRGYASFDHKRVPETGGDDNEKSALLGAGTLAMTIDPGGEMDRYQGIVALENESLSSAALTYFRQSEQLPTFLRLAVAKVYQPRTKPVGSADSGYWTWRAGGLLLQHIAHDGGNALGDTEGEPVPLSGGDDDGWRRTEMLAGTVEDHELTEPGLSPERLLYRLFHEEGVRVQESQSLTDHCGCSRERVTGFLSQFAVSSLDDLREEDGTINVTCEFCNQVYRYEKHEIGR